MLVERSLVFVLPSLSISFVLSVEAYVTETLRPSAHRWMSGWSVEYGLY